MRYVSLRLPEAWVDQAQARAKAERRTVSNFLRLLLAPHFEKHPE
jgi:hypothetical protein